MSSNACRRPSGRCQEKEGACGTSPQAQLHAHTHPRHPANVNARTSALGAPRATQYDVADPLVSGATT